MVRHPPGEGRALSGTASGLPLLVCAELPPDVFAWADALRREHYPPGRNRLGAHVTLFHGLPPSAEPAVAVLLADLSRRSPPAAVVAGLMDLGSGTAFALESPELSDLHADMVERLHGLVQQKDTRPFRPHITIQNKVTSDDARALQARLAPSLASRSFRFTGLGLYEWTGEIWRQARVRPFRGQK